MRQSSMSEKLPEIYTVEGQKVHGAYIDIYNGAVEEHQGEPCIFGCVHPRQSVRAEYVWTMQGHNIRPGDEGPRNRYNLVGNEQLFREAFPSEID
jgi:hypothetical protein